MKKYPHGLTLNAVCAAIDDYQRHEDSVPEEGILAAFNTLLGHSDIAAAFRALEQRAEAAEAKAKELEKQEPDYIRYDCGSCGYDSFRVPHKNTCPECNYRPMAKTELFTRPAPAAHRVPEGWKLVPVEITQEMVDANFEGVCIGGIQAGYRAMLAAAPEVE
ncbi:hypothetical protein ACE8EZ_22260 [Pantoea deleyi]|uniref:hypothetical protein n=1 Tax=Pantoea deleyi TaxID=470932 RepID=UPI0035D420CF